MDCISLSLFGPKYEPSHENAKGIRTFLAAVARSTLQKRRVKAVYGQTLVYYLTTNYIANWKVTGFYDCVKKCIVEFYDDCTYIDYTAGSDDCYFHLTILLKVRTCELLYLRFPSCRPPACKPRLPVTDMELRGLSVKLKPKQEEAVKHILQGMDVICNLPVGYGKIMIFHVLPDIYADIIFGHPESFLKCKSVVSFLHEIDDKVGAIIVDECHKIDDW
ncbi:unnamed protein product [Mytilus edulis]|uniref:Helicase ATP-binding domain-containing protein n=1 Tax=Mytilus edulis TaxID=6550 RepID=A0A8S3QNN4_MYTED|nr:unnamed protein product [Mytilus edulis]